MNQAAWTQFVGAIVLLVFYVAAGEILPRSRSRYCQCVSVFHMVWTEICGSVPRERSIHHLELLLLHGVSNLDGSQDDSEGFRCI